MTLGNWIKNREQIGRPCFSYDEVKVAFPMLSPNVLSSSLSRYRAKGVIQAVHRGFFVVIPPHCALQKRVPDTYYISQLAEHLGRKYYISLLSAASLWGASHQAVMQTHVMTHLPQSSISHLKNNTLRWFYRKTIPSRFLVSKNGETAALKYSNPELTAIDLVHWTSKIGGISSVATVLAELRETTDFRGSATGVFMTADMSDVQRLGYIYDVVLGDRKQSETIFAELNAMPGNVRNVLLVPQEKRSHSRRDDRWHIDVNEEIEVG